jgi:RecG-like helicase
LTPPAPYGSFKIAELPRDASLLTQAKKDANNIIDNDPGYGKELVRNWLSKAEDFSLA